MGVLVALQRGEPARCDFKIAQLARLLRVGKQNLAGDRLEQRALVFLIGKHIDAFPAVLGRFAVGRFAVRRFAVWRFALNEWVVRHRPYRWPFTAFTKSAVSSTSFSRADNRAPPISSMMSAP